MPIFFQGLMNQEKFLVDKNGKVLVFKEIHV